MFNHLRPSLSQYSGNLVSSQASQIHLTNLQYVVTTLQPAVFVCNTTRQDGLDHHAGTPAAHDAKTQAGAIVNQIYDFNLRPFRAQDHGAHCS